MPSLCFSIPIVYPTISIVQRFAAPLVFVCVAITISKPIHSTAMMCCLAALDCWFRYLSLPLSFRYSFIENWVLCYFYKNKPEKVEAPKKYISCYLLQSKYTICVKINKTQHSYCFKIILMHENGYCSLSDSRFLFMFCC